MNHLVRGTGAYPYGGEVKFSNVDGPQCIGQIMNAQEVPLGEK